LKNYISKNSIIIFIFALTAFLITSISYAFLNTKSILLKTNLTCNFREEVYVKDFIYKLDGTLKNNYKIDTSVVGKKKIRIVYQDKHGFYKVTSFEIEIKDVTPPTILVNDIYTVQEGYDKKLEDEILCADDYDDNIKCKITGSYNLEKAGNYPLKITAIDNSNNKTIKDLTLKVIDKTDNITKDNQTENESDSQNNSFVSFKEVYKKYKTKNTLIGVDISKWQEEVDFNKLKQSGVEFVIIKIGGQSKINSNFTLDPNFVNNIEEALKANIKVGLYFYSYAKTNEEAKKQAKFIIKNIKKYNIDLPIAFDWENWENYNKFKISFNTLNNVAKTFMDELENNGYETLLYSSQYYLENIWFSEDYDNNIWIANYGNLTYDGDYKIWQLCSDGKVDGINTYVDIDILYLNKSKNK
jgi:GH25 family lysozyme M1 (1,4-beta-N-acetylmuramidase)